MQPKAYLTGTPSRKPRGSHRPRPDRRPPPRVPACGLAGVSARSWRAICEQGGIGADCGRRPFDAEDAAARDYVGLLVAKLGESSRWPQPLRTLATLQHERDLLLAEITRKDQHGPQGVCEPAAASRRPAP